MGDASRSVDVTPTLTVAASYASGDYVGTSGVAMVFNNIAVGATGGGVLQVNVTDYSAGAVAGELWLFDSAVTPPADSAAWTISDADSAHIIAVIPFSVWYASALNAVSPSPSWYSFKCATGSKLYGCFVTRGSPSYSTGDLTFRMITFPTD
jgi:hypothetical protein